MPYPARFTRSKVFVSFAGDDRPMAERLGKELDERGIEAFIDVQHILPGENLVLAIDKAIDESDYFVLLWSRHTVDRPWVDLEWTTALARDLDRRRSFLFVVRLDSTPLPPILGMRRYLDAFGSWEAVADELAATWHRDREVGMPVLPALREVDVFDGEPTIVLYVRNLDLSVAHVVAMPSSVTGAELKDEVRKALALPDRVPALDGKVGLNFHYRFSIDGETIPDQSSALRITDGSMIDLEVTMSSWGPKGSNGDVTYRRKALGSERDEPAKLHPDMPHVLINSAFEHLEPRPR
ncbi:toll/interleukin-1 receptor domain-containing protein [Amycolatopsis nigrescens]|uniref:toll/interleukin-1 receptor domain-containing protein n=1 Tax=Amycolatopsis nigrescens TaxID=381445 RepID=UPI00036C107B|nr:toll/interleukin-1 receptor domain-containing protein [Amycolatopsis nigrescens]